MSARIQHTYAFRPDGKIAEPTIVGMSAANFNANTLAESLRTAIRGMGTDEETVSSILAKCNSRQRKQIAQVYKSTFGLDLAEDLKDELTGPYGSLVQALMMSRAEFCAHLLYKAMKGRGTDECVLLQVLTMQTNGEMAEIKSVFQEKYGKDLEEEVKSEVSGFFASVLIGLLQGQRDEASSDQLNYAMQTGRLDMLVNLAKAGEQAKQLYEAGVGRSGTDEDTFLRVLLKVNHFQMAALEDSYEGLCGGLSLLDSVKAEFSGHSRKALLALLRYLQDPQKCSAYWINKAIAGLGTNENLLNYIIVSRSEIDLAAVKVEYETIFGQSLKEALVGDCSGDHLNLLLALIGEQE